MQNVNAWAQEGEVNVAWAARAIHCAYMGCRNHCFKGMGCCEQNMCNMASVCGVGGFAGACALEASQGHVPEVQGLPGAFHVHVVKQSCAGVEGRSLEGPAVQCVHGPSTTV